MLEDVPERDGIEGRAREREGFERPDVDGDPEDLARVRVAGREIGVSPLLVGILPTIRKSDLGLENMTPNPRYFALKLSPGIPTSATLPAV